MGFYRTAVGAELELVIEHRAVTARSPRSHRAITADVKGSLTQRWCEALGPFLQIRHVVAKLP